MKKSYSLNLLLFTILFFFTFSCVFLAGLLFFENNKHFKEQYSQNIHFRTKLFKENIESSLIMGDYSAVLEKAHSFFSQKDISSVSIILKDNTELVGLTRDTSSDDLKDTDEVKLFDPTAGNSELVAIVRISFSADEFNKIERDFIFKGLVTLLILVALSFIVIYFFTRVINRPLRELSSLAASGDLNVISKLISSSHIQELFKLQSEMKKMAEKIMSLNEVEKENIRNAAIVRVSQNIAHDLRSPLGIFERLINAPIESMDSARTSIREALSRLYSMIESLRHSEIEGFIKRSQAKIDFNYGAENLAFKASQLSIDLIVPMNFNDILWIDSLKVERAWINLASNAIDAAKSFVRVEVDRLSTCLRIRVIDDGSGVSPDLLPRLFQREMTHGKMGGTGLGLAYVKQIMQGHGGDVTYQRADNISVFECTVPHAYGQDDDAEQDMLQSKSESLVDIGIKKIAIKITPDSLALKVCESLRSYKSKNFEFSCAVDQETRVIVMNSDELLFQAMEDGIEPLQLSKKLDHQQIIDRLILKFNLS